MTRSFTRSYTGSDTCTLCIKVGAVRVGSYALGIKPVARLVERALPTECLCFAKDGLGIRWIGCQGLVAYLDGPVIAFLGQIAGCHLRVSMTIHTLERTRLNCF